MALPETGTEIQMFLKLQSNMLLSDYGEIKKCGAIKLFQLSRYIFQNEISVFAMSKV